jgi:membrane protease YdiL (CAAX protease family)
MKTDDVLTQDLKKSGGWTIILTLLFLLFYGKGGNLSDMIIALPFFIAFYYFFFSVGKDIVSERLQQWIGSDVKKVAVFPLILLLLYLIYVLINGQAPWQGIMVMIPYFLLFPLLFFVSHRRGVSTIGWVDFTALVIYLLPTIFIKVKPEGNLPFKGEDFDSIYRIILILVAVYAFSTVRGLKGVGFYPVFNLKYLWTAIWVWAAFYSFVLIVGYPVNFVKYIGHDMIDQVLLHKIALTLLATFFHTAIFEELFFRGILLNMLAKRIGQARSWKVFWIIGFAASIPLALLVGYTLTGEHQWFPALMVVLLYSAAYFIENGGKQQSGSYTALAISGTIFGLVHYHSKAIIYIGFACIAGWAYGYTYLKTKNVFYSAIVHMLVNCSVLIFGLEFIK